MCYIITYMHVSYTYMHVLICMRQVVRNSRGCRWPLHLTICDSACRTEVHKLHNRRAYACSVSGGEQKGLSPAVHLSEHGAGPWTASMDRAAVALAPALTAAPPSPRRGALRPPALAPRPRICASGGVRRRRVSGWNAFSGKVLQPRPV
jgi:hypothetical protein